MEKLNVFGVTGEGKDVFSIVGRLLRFGRVCSYTISYLDENSRMFAKSTAAHSF